MKTPRQTTKHCFRNKNVYEFVWKHFCFLGSKFCFRNNVSRGGQTGNIDKKDNDSATLFPSLLRAYCPEQPIAAPIHIYIGSWRPLVWPIVAVMRAWTAESNIQVLVVYPKIQETGTDFCTNLDNNILDNEFYCFASKPPTIYNSIYYDFCDGHWIND